MLVLLITAVLAWGTAIYLVQLHFSRGPAQQSINIRWAPDVTELARHTAERTLKLGVGEESDPGTWVYHLQDHSRDAIRRIVTHPLASDTGHIDRQAFRIRIDAPAMPVWLRRLLEADLGPPIALALAALGLTALWIIRRDLLLCVDIVRSVPGLEAALAVLVLGIGFRLFYDNGQGVDENIHYDQIARLAKGQWTLHPSLTMLPGFHAIVAAAVWVSGGVGEFSVRLVVFLLSLSTVGAFYALASTLDPDHAGTRTLQFTLLPVLFPQFFLIYTDVTSLLFVLLMMLAAARRHYWSAGTLGLVSCLVRQNNVLWVAFVMLWSYVRDSGWTWRPLIGSVARYWTFLATGMAFLLFIAVNGGQVALGEDAASHPLGSVHATNIFFLLFLSCFLFVPLWGGYRREMAAHLRAPWPWLALVLLFPVFWLGFVVDHPHNAERADFFLPNAILLYFSSTAPRRLLFFVPVAIATLFVASTPMRKPWSLLFPFTILFLLPEWLVTPRYYLIPLSLFLLAREHTSPWSERLQTAVFAVGSVWLFLVVERGWGWV